MNVRHGRAKVLATLIGGALLLTACSTGSGTSGSSSSSAANTVITAAYEQEFSAYNNQTSGNAALKNQIILNQVLPSVWEYAADGSVQPVKDFGSYSKTSDSPLTVVYEVNDKAVWSDGTPIDCSDFVLQWAAQSGKFPDAGFQPASTSGFESTQQPQCAAGDKKITVVYDKPFADWVATFGGIANNLLPAHVVEKQTGVASIIDAVTNKDAASLKKIAQFWNTGWSLSPGQLKKDIMPSSGPYMFDSWKAGESITLTANPKYWGDPPKTAKIVIKFLKQESQAQALENGDVQVAEPQPNPDVINQLKAVGDSITILQGDQFSFEHLDFNFKGQFKDPTLRKAFALCVPRQQIVDTLIKPVNPKAIVMDSRFVFPFQPTYDQISTSVGAQAYSAVNIEESKRLLAGRKITVRVGHNTPNQRRTDETGLIKASCEKAGFTVQDIGSDDFFNDGGVLDSGNFDVALYAWIGSSLLTPNYSLYTTGAGQNKIGYSNATVDKTLQQLNVTTDPDQQQQLLTTLDQQMWNDVATIPLFAFPGVAAHSTQIGGVVYQPAQSGLEWNMQQWGKSAN